jgi:hypothetical protein
MAHEQEPNYDNVVFLDEYPQFIERRRVKEALGQLTLAVNTDPGQLLLFTGAGEELPDGAA